MTNGEKIKAVFPDCKDWKAKIEENEEVYEVHFVQLPNSIIINKYEESWWNAEYKEPIAKNDLGVDCISREQALNEFCIYNPYDSIGVDKVRNYLKALPPITPIRPKGHWISHREHCRNLGVTPSGLGAYEWCSNCDCGIDVREWYRSRYNYCPNCGADMREVEE